jgi:hypothetical protein
MSPLRRKVQRAEFFQMTISHGLSDLNIWDSAILPYFLKRFDYITTDDIWDKKKIIKIFSKTTNM